MCMHTNQFVPAVPVEPVNVHILGNDLTLAARGYEDEV